MIKKLGWVFGLLFILLAMINHANNPEIVRLNVLGLGIIGVLYIYTSFNLYFAKIIQTLLLFVYGSVAFLYNDGNVLVSMFCFYISGELMRKYYPKKYINMFVLGSIYITFAVLAGWTFFHIIGSVLMYSALTIIIYIIQNDKV
jgi:hypothetical protein